MYHYNFLSNRFLDLYYSYENICPCLNMNIFTLDFQVEDPELAPSQPDCGFYPAPPGLQIDRQIDDQDIVDRR